MKALLENVNAQIALFQANAAAQVEKNNKAAGTRARKAALELTKLLKEFRKVSVAEANKK
ncbi:MAG: histone H1 [Alistipes sp.]|nr:histone H1 [Alistipes sp.]